MVNPRRGEVEIMLDGTPHCLCLTLGALGELEHALDVKNISELVERFASNKVATKDLIKVLGAALRGGGQAISDEQAARMRCEGGATELFKALVDLLSSSFGACPQEKDEMPGKPHGERARSA